MKTTLKYIEAGLIKEFLPM